MLPEPLCLELPTTISDEWSVRLQDLVMLTSQAPDVRRNVTRRRRSWDCWCAGSQPHLLPGQPGDDALTARARINPGLFHILWP